LFHVGTGVGAGVRVVTTGVGKGVMGVTVWFWITVVVTGTGMPVLTGCPVIMGFTTSAMTRMITTAAIPYMISFLSIALLKILNIFT
jgi:hypothetical protein